MTGSELISARIAQYLANFRHYYPGILDWYSGIEDEFVSGRRSMFISWDGSDVAGLAITKNGIRAKLCHISVSPSARRHGIGSALINTALFYMAYRGAQEIRVTTSEEVLYSHGTFFRVAGFTAVDWQAHRYRRNISEILWKIDVGSVKRRYPRHQSCRCLRNTEIFGNGSAKVDLPLSNKTNPILFEKSTALAEPARLYVVRWASPDPDRPITAAKKEPERQLAPRYFEIDVRPQAPVDRVITGGGRSHEEEDLSIPTFIGRQAD